MHNGKNGTNNGNSRISGDARAAAPAANAQDGMAVKRRDGTQNTLSSFPGWFMDAGPEAQPLPVPVTPAEGHGAGLAEVFMQDVKDSLAAAGHASGPLPIDWGKSASGGRACQPLPKDLKTPAGQCDGDALPEAFGSDAASAQVAKPAQPSGDMAPAGQVMPAAVLLPEGASRQPAADYPFRGSAGVSGRPGSFAVPECAVIWARGTNSDKCLLVQASLGDLVRIIKQGELCSRLAFALRERIRVDVGGASGVQMRGAAVTRRQRIWGEVGGYLEKCTAQKAVSSVAQDLFAKAMQGRLSYGFVIDGVKGGDWSLFLHVAMEGKAPLVSKEISAAFLREVCAEIAKRNVTEAACADAGGVVRPSRCGLAE